MATQTIEKRVERLERRVTNLERLPERMDRVESQIVQLRTEMHDEFSAVREEIRTAGEEVKRELREEIRAGDEETRRLMRVLHEEPGSAPQRRLMRVLHETSPRAAHRGAYRAAGVSGVVMTVSDASGPRAYPTIALIALPADSGTEIPNHCAIVAHTSGNEAWVTEVDAGPVMSERTASISSTPSARNRYSVFFR